MPTSIFQPYLKPNLHRKSQLRFNQQPGFLFECATAIIWMWFGSILKMIEYGNWNKSKRLKGLRKSLYLKGAVEILFVADSTASLNLPPRPN